MEVSCFTVTHQLSMRSAAFAPPVRLGGVGPVSVEEMKPDWETPEGRGGDMFERRQEPLATLWRFAAFLQIEGGREEVETEGRCTSFPSV